MSPSHLLEAISSQLSPVSRGWRRGVFCRDVCAPRAADAAVFEFLHHLGRVGLRRRPDEPVEMLRHEDVSDDLEPQLAPKVSQAGKPLVSETLGIIEARASIGALGHVMQMVEAVIVLELWHGKIISLQGRLHADKTRRHVGATRGRAADLEKQVCAARNLVQIGNSRERWARLCRSALRKACGFPANGAGGFLVRAGWKAMPSSPPGGDHPACTCFGKAEPFRTASGGAAGHSPPDSV